ncbi:MAG TPA: DUF308 domain-containing protein [Puia sp.]|nr:DUF308 domain-containing protein [Puia sp.]
MSTILDTITDDVKNWWWFIIKGLLFIIAGIAIFYRPAEGYVGLSVLFSLVMMGSGLSQIFFGIVNSDILPGWGWTLAGGIIDLAIGIYLFAYPAVTMVTLPYILGFWLMFAGFYLMGAALDLKNLEIKNWGWLLFGGLLTIVCAFLVLYYPAAGAVSIVTWSGIAFLTVGIFNVVLAFKLKSVKKTATKIERKYQHA